MINFKKDKKKLFSELRNLIVENIDYADIKDYDEADIAELVIELKDKKRIRLLKKLLVGFDLLTKEYFDTTTITPEEKQ